MTATLSVASSTQALGQIQRSVLYALMQQLNTVLTQVEQAWDASDSEMADFRGIAYEPTNLEPVELENFHEGHRPSLIGAPVERYPNVSVICSNSNISPGSAAYDHQTVYRIDLLVEVMVKALPAEGEEVCNRRALRMVEATHAVVAGNETLGGFVTGFDVEPTGSITQLFTRKHKSHHGPEWFWQGGTVKCSYRKPSVGSSIGSVPAPQDLGIDQA